jgi:hypothetical protein
MVELIGDLGYYEQEFIGSRLLTQYPTWNPGVVAVIAASRVVLKIALSMV